MLAIYDIQASYIIVKVLIIYTVENTIDISW
jgi:hypothetical protein